MSQSEEIWEKLSQVALHGAEYDSPERQPHPKCLIGTRVNLLDYIYDLTDSQEKSQIIWLNGTAGVGKSAVAFTVAERMRGLEVTEQRPSENRLAGTFFFSRKHTERCTTGYFFATLVYQLASNFPSIRDDLNTAIRENPGLLDPKKSLRKQMEVLFLRPLRRLQLRLLKPECLPVVFVVDAVDECTREAEAAELISLLGQALRGPGLPVIHILLTSRSEAHIRGAMHEEEVRPLVCEIPVKTSGEGVTSLISLDGADVDSDIYIFLKHSFTKLRSNWSNFPQPTKHELERLANRAGRRFIVASTMMKFIDDGHNDPRSRLQLMLELTSKLLPGTEVYKLYDHILSTCADPKRAYLHLSVVAALANPLPMSQISELLGPGEGKDVETALVQLRSVMDIPTDSSLPINIYHSSVRDYVSNPSNCGLFEAQCMTPPHTLLAYSSFCLMIHDIPNSTGLLDALLALKTQSQAMESHPPQSLRHSLSFIVEPPTTLGVLITLLWLRGNRSPQSYSWLETPNGRAWLRHQGVKDWLETIGGVDWLKTQAGLDWLQSPIGRDWLPSQSGRDWLRLPSGRDWLRLPSGRDWLWLPSGKDWLQSPSGWDWLQSSGTDWLQSPSGTDWLQSPSGTEWLQSPSGTDWLSQSGRDWLPSPSGTDWLLRDWLPLPSRRDWLPSSSGKAWLESLSGKAWLESPSGSNWLESRSGSGWLKSPSGSDWLQSPSGLDWLQSPSGLDWLRSPSGLNWLWSPSGLDWLQSLNGLDWLQSLISSAWLQLPNRSDWLQSPIRMYWWQSLIMRYWWLSPAGRKSRLRARRLLEWLQSRSGLDWLQSPNGRHWLQSRSGTNWLQSPNGRHWLQSLHSTYYLMPSASGSVPSLRVSDEQSLQVPSEQSWQASSYNRNWLQTPSGRGWLQTLNGHEWLQTFGGRAWLQFRKGVWLQTSGGRDWLQTPGGRDWLLTSGGQDWLQALHGCEWLQTENGRGWLQTQGGREWLLTPHGQAWQSTPAASFWVQMEEFLDTVETISEFMVVPELPLLTAFQAIWQFKSLPDFLMFPAFLTLTPQIPTSTLTRCPDMEIIHSIKAFMSFTNEARERSQSASDALTYACQNWAMHLSRAPNAWDNKLIYIFKVFWNHHLLSWLERQWCLRGLRSCLVVLSEAQKLEKEHLHVPESELSQLTI